MEYDEVTQRIQAGCFIEDGQLVIVAMRGDLPVIEARFVKGQGGQVGRGGFQDYIPMRAFSKYFGTHVAFDFDADPEPLPLLKTTTETGNAIFAKEAAARIGCSLAQVYTLARRRVIRTHRVAGVRSVVFDGRSVDSYAALQLKKKKT